MILEAAGISEDTKVQDWTDDNVKFISKFIQDEYRVEGELCSEVQLSIKRLMDIVCYRGLRHRKGLPVRVAKVLRIMPVHVKAKRKP